MIELYIYKCISMKPCKIRLFCVFLKQKLRFRHGSHETHGTWQGQSYNLCLDLDGSSSDDLRPGNVLSFQFLVPIWGAMLEVFWDRRRLEDIRNSMFSLTFGTERLVLCRKALSYYLLCMLLCTPRNFRSRKRPRCHDLDHFLLVLIATLSVHSILRIYVTGVTAIHPIYIQAVSSQTLTATCLEGPDWNCNRNSEDDDWKENMREAISKNWKKWKVKVLHLLMCWNLLWNIVMKRVHGRLQHWYRDIIGWDLWCCIGVCYVVGKQPGRGGQPPDVWIFGQKICDLMRLLMWRSLLMRLDWCLAPTTGMNFKFHEFHR